MCFLYYVNCVKLTFFIASAAFDTSLLVDFVRILHCAGDGVNRAISCAGGTSLTLVRINNILFQSLALTGRTFLIYHVGNILIPEVVDG